MGIIQQPTNQPINQPVSMSTPPKNLRNQLPHLRHQLRDPKRLSDNLIHPRLNGRIDLLAPCIRSDCYDWYVAQNLAALLFFADVADAR
jgi:hypothetical protein